MATAPAPSAVLAASPSAIRTLRLERMGLTALERMLEGDMAGPFDRACGIVAAAEGRVIVTGMGKSGHVARKIAATMASTGTPAIFVHPAEASHGDLGMVTSRDVVIALSWSGETSELHNIVFYSRRFRVPLVAITSRAGSTLARAADVALVLPQVEEACPLGLAPTTSSLIQLAIGDALAMALLERRGFTTDDFLNLHPGGSLGARLAHVSELMHTGERVPLVSRGMMMREAIIVMTSKGFGCLGVADEDGRLVGILTDGDLRRRLTADIFEKRVEEVMTADPKTIAPDALAASALEILNTASITALFVVQDGAAVGIIHMHDLLRAGIA